MMLILIGIVVRVLRIESQPSGILANKGQMLWFSILL